MYSLSRGVQWKVLPSNTTGRCRAWNHLVAALTSRKTLHLTHLSCRSQSLPYSGATAKCNISSLASLRYCCLSAAQSAMLLDLIVHKHGEEGTRHPVLPKACHMQGMHQVA